METEQVIRELADKLTEIADSGSLTREDALREFTLAYNALVRFDEQQ